MTTSALKTQITGGSWRWLLLLLLGMALSGCNGGSTGDRGPAGKTGPAGPDVAQATAAKSLHITINSVAINKGPPVVQLSITDQTGLGVTGVSTGAIEATIAKLVPGTDGDTDHWQNYINHWRNAVATSAPETKAIQPSTDSGGTLVDHGDGTYTYTFGTDITRITTANGAPKDVPYVPDDTHRVAIAIRSSTLPSTDNNGIYTWQPSTGATTEIPERAIAETASCNQCHTQLAAHGGPRKDVRMCVTCHNPGNSDPNTGDSLDFRVMIHKIHDASNLPSFVNDSKPYEVYGYRNSVVSFTNPPVVFPQDIRNCTVCHDPSNPATPDAANFKEHPSIQACGSCHDDVNFATGANHPGGPQADNSQCTVCHRDNGLAPVVAVHRIPGKVWAAKFQFNIIKVVDADDSSQPEGKVAPGDHPAVTFSVTNPENKGSVYDITRDPSFTSSAAALKLDFAWPTTDYTNSGSPTTGSTPSEAMQVNALGDCISGASDCVHNSDGSFTVTSPYKIPATIPDPATGTGSVKIGSALVGIEGHPAGDFNNDGNYTDEVPATSVNSYFAVNDAQAVPNRVAKEVDVKKCQVCHGTNDGLAMHGNNRTDDVQLCVACHNPRDTDISDRPADPDSTVNGTNTAAADNLEQRTIDFKRMVHAIHGVGKRKSENAPPYIVYGYGHREHNFADIRFPGEVRKCSICHSNSSYQVPLNADALATTVDTGVTMTSSGVTPSDGSVNDPSDDKVITPTASVCSACHAGTLAQAHMGQNGALFDAPIAELPNVVESCAICHGPGAMADVDVVHGLK